MLTFKECLGRDITIVYLKFSLKSLADISLRFLVLRFRHVVFTLSSELYCAECILVDGSFTFYSVAH